MSIQNSNSRENSIGQIEHQPGAASDVIALVSSQGSDESVHQRSLTGAFGARMQSVEEEVYPYMTQNEITLAPPGDCALIQ